MSKEVSNEQLEQKAESLLEKYHDLAAKNPDKDKLDEIEKTLNGILVVFWATRMTKKFHLIEEYPSQKLLKILNQDFLKIVNPLNENKAFNQIDFMEYAFLAKWILQYHTNEEYSIATSGQLTSYGELDFFWTGKYLQNFVYKEAICGKFPELNMTFVKQPLSMLNNGVPFSKTLPIKTAHFPYHQTTRLVDKRSLAEPIPYRPNRGEQQWCRDEFLVKSIMSIAAYKQTNQIESFTQEHYDEILFDLFGETADIVGEAKQRTINLHI